MEEALSKIRVHVSSNLAHQKAPATLLCAMEETLREQKADLMPTAYFAALLTTLEGTIQKKDLALGDGDILPAELYLLALISPFVPPSVLRTNLNIVLSLTAQLFPSVAQHAPAIKSQLSLYSVLIQSLERSQLESAALRQPFASILQLCLDPRPKVRKKAADVVRDILASPPPPMLLHPYAERVANWLRSALEESSNSPLAKKTGKGSEAPGAESAIHLLAFLRPVIKNLPSSLYPEITKILLTLPRLGNLYLSQSAYSVLSDLLVFSREDDPTFTNDQVPTIINAILSSPPSKSDIAVSPPWVLVLGNAMLSYHMSDVSACDSELGKVWKTVWPFLESSDSSVRKATMESLKLQAQCISSSLISSAVAGGDKSTLGRILSQTLKSMDSLAYARSVPEILAVVSSLLTNILEKDHTPAVVALLLPLVKYVGDLRTQKGFDYKEAVDSTLSAAMSTMGPKVVFDVLPLNLDPADREAGREPRAYLLPTLTQAHPSPLSHFISYFVPLSERMFDLQQKAETEGRQSEAKVWAVLVDQVWSGLVGYCHGTVDLKESLTPQFSQLLSQLLYGQLELRPAVLKALKVLVDSNVAIVNDEADKKDNPAGISQEQAKENIAFLQSQSESWLAVFFNVFGTVNRDSRNAVGDVIISWASIAGQQEIAKAYTKVMQLFKDNLSKPQPAQGPDGNLTVTMQDLLLLLLPHLSPTDSVSLFQSCLTQQVLGAKDNGIQKRGYKILAKLVESGKVPVEAESLLRKLDELSDGLSAPAKKDRFNLLVVVIPHIPESALHLIVSLIPEAVLGTKEPSDKARTAAFETILAMARKMKEGGVVKRNMIDGMDQDDGSSDSQASIEEFLTMMAGGLAGASPHMISATVTAISRLVFEFKDDISSKMHEEIVTTLLVFLSSANREIVKSVLGFVKLAIHTLPIEVLRPHMPQLVPALLNWSHDHKNHFKVKVRHIFERILRRFSFEEVLACANDSDATKVLTNIKKRKERAKRKKAEGKDDEDDVPTAKPVAGDAFEDVLYGSESELEDSDDDAMDTSNLPSDKKKGAKGNKGTRLRMDGDNPIDLLQGAASRLTDSNSNHRRRPGQDAAKFKTDEDTGKMIINDADSDEEPDVNDPIGTAYGESFTSVDGFTRGPNGRVKFNKDTKKRRREEAIDEDVEMGDTEADTGKTIKQKKSPKLGHEFKAKRAGGDVKKGGVDPYAYMSLAQAAKKGAGKKNSRMGVARR